MNSPLAIFVGDIHLREDKPEAWQDFFDFLQGPALSAPELFIVGDLFHAWAGDDSNSSLANACKKALKKLSSAGVRMTILNGNHDFCLGERFCRDVGARYGGFKYKCKLGGKTFLLIHGDTLCTKDVKYIRYRKFLPLIRLVIKLLPLSYRLSKAQQVTKKKKAVKPNIEQLLAIDNQLAERLLQQHAADLIIHGHTHLPEINDCGNGQRAVVPAWLGGKVKGGWIELRKSGLEIVTI